MIAFDATRLFLGPLARTPRGIDRVDLAFARHFFAHHPGDCVAILPTAWGVRAFSRERALRGLDRLEELWLERDEARDDAPSSWLQAGEPAVGSRGRLPVQRDGIAAAGRMIALLRATGLATGRSVVSALPRGAIYLNIGQIGLSVPLLLHWLGKRRDVLPVFMLHDVIPLETPEYVEPNAVKGHRTMVEQTARHAAGLIVTSGAARSSIESALQGRRSAPLPTFARPLPVHDAFRNPIAVEPAPDAACYFVICGAIEPRKNHLLLLEVWRLLVEQLGAGAPRLVIAGSPGWQGRAILDRFMRSNDVGKHVQIASGLSTPSLQRLISGARALLMPSFIEGFGLPVIEAAALGTPVVASDIPAHREIAHPSTIFISPIDGPGWVAAIAGLLRGSHSETRIAVSPVASTWSDYFRELETFLGELEVAAH